MKQANLDGFLNVKQERSVPEIFCLHYTHDDLEVSLSIEEGCVFYKYVNIKYRKGLNQIGLYVHRSILESKLNSSTDTNNQVYCAEAGPFLKSLLQKSIRRGFVDHALFACYHLLKLDFSQLYRRLPIIMIEDVFIHKSFGPLIWLMISQMKPNEIIYYWILGVVKHLCTDQQYILYRNNFVVHDKIPKHAIIWSIVFRIEYGGMKGDIEMMRDLISQIHGKMVIVSEAKIIPYCDTVNTPSIIMYEAIDFHIHPLILTGLQFSQEYLKNMMWSNASSINYRKKNQPYQMSDWLKVCHEIRKRQISYHNRLLIA